MHDFLEITETPGALLNHEQLGRMVLRYSLAAELAAGCRVLEIACGAGLGLGLLCGVARSVAACDCSLAALALAQRAADTQVAFSAADAQSLPFAACSFDLLLCFEAIYYLSHPAVFLNECRRLLAAGGRLLLSTSNPDWPYFAPGALSVSYPSATELLDLLRQAGFATVELYGSLPVDQSLSRLGAMRAQVRRHLLRLRCFRRDNRLVRAIKRLSYGALTPLPTQLPASLRVAAPFESLSPLPLDRPDRRHRVLYLVAA